MQVPKTESNAENESSTKFATTNNAEGATESNTEDATETTCV